jgi:phage gp46-like protein
MIGFEGDVFLFQTNDNGDINIENGIIEMTGGLETTMYLSLFGGNFDENSEWWGNLTENNDVNKLISRTQSFIENMPLTTQNIERLKEVILIDLDWLKSENIANEINVNVFIVDINRIDIIININAFGEQIDFRYTLNWQTMQNKIN